jgi:hypothetical protein
MNKTTEEFYERTETIRGVEYKFREVDAQTHDDAVRLVADEDGNAELNAVLKILAAKSLIEPKLDVEGLGRKPYPVQRRILDIANVMYYGPVEKPAEKAAEGEAAPNAA